MEENERYTMKYVSRSTGLTPHTIRAWEKRYRAVVPDRTETNRRLYSDEDIQKLFLLRKATLAGHKIGQIAAMSHQKLKELVERKPGIVHEEDLKSNGLQTLSPDEAIEEALKAVYAMDPARLEAVLYQASSIFSRPVLIEQFLARLLLQIGDHWQNGSLRIAHEHFSSSIIHRFLVGLCRDTSLSQSAPVILTATPIGQHHEFGALLIAATAVGAGWRNIYFGGNLPAEEIAGAAVAKEVQAVALSLIFPAGDPRLMEELQTLRQCLAQDISIIAGGQSAWSYKKILDSIGATLLPDCEAFRNHLNLISVPHD